MIQKEKIEFDSIAVLGSTGSVGLQALDVARYQGIKINAISANSNIKMLEEQIREFSPEYCAVADLSVAKELKIATADTSTKILAGEHGICQMIEECSAPVVLNSILGSAGLLPTLTTLRTSRRLALANKESLVVAGKIVMAEAACHNAEIIPVDSEHSAIFQSLLAGRKEEVKKIILTASGGPFWARDISEFGGITPSDALAHPTWNMGAKITIDSATMMNKGLEVIEAAHLFGVKAEQIEVLIHRESIIHSMVEYIDNTVISQMGTPDMRSCVQYAISYPYRVQGISEPLNFGEIGTLSFSVPDKNKFPLLFAAFSAFERGGVIPAALNAADEVAVAEFLAGRLSFTGISDIVIKTADRFSADILPTLDNILSADKEARIIAAEMINSRHLKPNIMTEQIF